jgi:hypothetical protein
MRQVKKHEYETAKREFSIKDFEVVPASYFRIGAEHCACCHGSAFQSFGRSVVAIAATLASCARYSESRRRLSSPTPRRARVSSFADPDAHPKIEGLCCASDPPQHLPEDFPSGMQIDISPTDFVLWDEDIHVVNVL